MKKNESIKIKYKKTQNILRNLINKRNKTKENNTVWLITNNKYVIN